MNQIGYLNINIEYKYRLYFETFKLKGIFFKNIQEKAHLEL